MSEAQVRCPECGARNGSDAEWCTQCYTSLAPEQSPPPDPPAAPPNVPSTPGTTPPTRPTPPTPPPPPPTDGSTAPWDEGLLPLPPAPGELDGEGAGEPRALHAGSGRFRETAEGLEWVCATCGEWNPIERVTCTICSTPFGNSLGSEEPVTRPDVPDAVLAGTSLVVPGAGHWMLGLRGAAVLRALLGLVWGMGGLTLFLQARASGQSFLPAVPLLLGWAIVAAGSANDAVVEGGGSGSIVLQGRVLLWLTLGVVGGTFAAVLVGVLAAVGS